MRILTIDGALARCSAALWQDGTVLAQAMVDGARGHPSTLPPLVEQVLAEAGLAVTALDAVAVVVGPGGFTGLRSALSLAEGLAIAGGIAAIGITTGEALVASLPDWQRGEREAWAMLDGRKGRVLYERIGLDGGAEELPLMTLPEALPLPDGPLLLLGEAAAMAAEALRARGAEVTVSDIALIEPAAIARLAAERLVGCLPPRGIAPLYGEPPNIRRPAGAGA